MFAKKGLRYFTVQESDNITLTVIRESIQTLLFAFSDTFDKYPSDRHKIYTKLS